MKFSKEEENKIALFSPLFKQCARLLRHCWNDLLYGECTEEEVGDILTKLEPKEHGYICPEDYMTVDECLRYLNMPRKQFYDRIVHRRKLQPHYFKNKSMGYRRDEVERYLQENRCYEWKRLAKKNKRERK